MIQFRQLLTSLSSNEVSFVIIGGVAATLHGSARVTYDLDVVYERSFANLQRIVAALAPYKPYLRGAPPGLPFRFDEETLKRGLNFTFTTTEGPIDLLGELTGIGAYSAVRAHALEVEMLGARYFFIDLDALIVSKRAAGRAKDLETVAELELIRDEGKPST
jgi:predicted nucleotidyltransferase